MPALPFPVDRKTGIYSMSATRDRSAVVRPCAPRRGGATGRVTGPFFHGSVPGSGAPGMARAGAAVKPAPRDVAGPFGTFRARPAPGLPAPRAHADARPRALAMRSGHTGRPVKPDLRIGAATVGQLRPRRRDRLPHESGGDGH